MLLTNYHTHCHYCDGKGSPKEMIAQAKTLGFQALGFSSHAPLPFENDFCLQEQNLSAYLEEINQLKSTENIEIYLGLEIDAIHQSMAPNDPKWDALELDYKIGSVHNLFSPDKGMPLLSVDSPLDEFNLLLHHIFKGNAQKMIETYYLRISQLCQQGGFDILGHYDLIKKHNLELQFFLESEGWYREIAIETLNDVAKADVIMEVNYGGILRKATKEVYPPLWLLKEAKKRAIPVQINADAHAPSHLGVHHQACRNLLLEAGYKEQRVLLKGKWQDLPL